MLDDGLPDDGESQADPLRFPRDERFEQLGGDFRRRTGTIIKDLEDDIILVGIGADLDVSIGTCGLDSVHDEIEEGIAEALAIAVDLEDLESGDRAIDCDLGVFAEGFDEGFNFGEEHPDMEPADGALFLFADSEEALHVLFHHGQLLESDGEAFLIAGILAAALVDLDREAGAGQGITHLMGETSSELSEDARSFCSADQFLHGTNVT